MPVPSPSQPPQRILIVRLSALGDLVFCTSLLAALRRAYPQAHIAWLAQTGPAELLREDPRLDALITRPRHALRSLSALHALRSELRAQSYDWVIDAQGLAKSRVLAWLAGGRRRIGLRSKEPLGQLMHELVERGGDIADIASEYRHLAEHLTGEPAAAPRLPVSVAASERVRTAMRAIDLQTGFFALCPYTTRPQKHWPDAHWVQLAAKLKGRCAVFGGASDRAAAARLVAAMPPGSINLAGSTATGDLAAWMTQARAVIGVDTGLTHIGTAVGTPTVALFGSTRPYTRGTDAPLAVFHDGLPCAPCKRHPSCDGAYTCMRQITADRVALRIQPLLRQRA